MSEPLTGKEYIPYIKLLFFKESDIRLRHTERLSHQKPVNESGALKVRSVKLRLMSGL